MYILQLSCKNDQIESTCDLASSNGNLDISEFQIRFNDPVNELGNVDVCSFGKPDNLPMGNGQWAMGNGGIYARYEQEFKLNILEGAQICNMSMSFPNQNFRYDDVFFLNFNGFLIATNASYTTLELESLLLDYRSGGSLIDIFKYDWSKLAGYNWVENGFNVNSSNFSYCPGLQNGTSNCSWPASERSGNITLNIDPKIIRAMSALNSSSQSFSFVTAGDNEPDQDCRHSEINFTAIIQYLLFN